METTDIKYQWHTITPPKNDKLILLRWDDGVEGINYEATTAKLAHKNGYVGKTRPCNMTAWTYLYLPRFSKKSVGVKIGGRF